MLGEKIKKINKYKKKKDKKTAIKIISTIFNINK
jgi:hypothetical protein